MRGNKYTQRSLAPLSRGNTRMEETQTSLEKMVVKARTVHCISSQNLAHQLRLNYFNEITIL